MKFIFFFLSFFVYLSNSFACNKSIDGSKVMIFVDTNFSDLEIETARKAACQRGERLQVIPKNYKEYSADLRLIESKEKEFKSCKLNCESLKNEFETLQKRIIERRTADGKIGALLRNELDEVKKSGNSKITNFIISGHDGGGTFGGYKGSISRDDLDNILTNFSDINDVKTLMLLGCYTGVKQEVNAWKEVFPNVRMIGGYDGSAPLSDRPLGHNYLEDLLRNEDKILAQADSSRLNRYMSGAIRGLNTMNTAIYTEVTCGEETRQFYYASQAGRNFDRFDKDYCQESANEILSLQAEFEKLNSGEIEPPASPSESSIQNLYNKSRRLQHCIEAVGSTLDPNAILNLRFYKNVKNSFARFYEKEIQFASDMADGLSSDQLLKAIDLESEKLDQLALEFQAELDEFNQDPQKFIQSQSAKMDNLSYGRKHLEAQLDGLFSRFETGKDYNVTTEEKAWLAKLKDLDERSRMLSVRAHSVNMLPESLKEFNDNYLKQRRDALLSARKVIDENGVWAPTSTNLQKFSRRQLRENLHKIDGLLHSNILPYEKVVALQWMSNAQATHLLQFVNPFLWHESRAVVDRPEYVRRMRFP